jgi:uncharacterized membrane protein YfcA
LALAGFAGGLAVGIAGMGGGALFTPALVLVFKLDPRVAIASDLVNALAMKPVGGAVHAAHGSVSWKLVRLLVAGGVPAAFFGAWLLNQSGDTKAAQGHLKTLLGWALLVACASLLARLALSARLKRRGRQPDNESPYQLKPLPTALVGTLGGFMVGMTSVGSGSIVIVLLMLLYPRLSTRVHVGTNLVQAVPLVAAAALGQALFGHISLHVAGGLLVGSLPGTFLGARLSSRAPDSIVRPALVALLTASGLGLLLSSASGLAWALGVAAVVGPALWGAVDATLHLSEDWEATGHHRANWVALMGIGAPVGLGLAGAAFYALRVRPQVARAARTRALQAAALTA